ncbi:MAG: hypothetical protein RIB46_10015 [Pseudomonadales bacterium]
MRITLDIDDDVLEAARALAAADERPLGEVVSDLARRGLTALRESLPSGRGLPKFAVPSDSPPLTLDDVKRDEDEPD